MDEKEFEEKVALCIHKEWGDMTEEERKTATLEEARCAQSFWHFLKYCKIVEPPTLENAGGIIPLVMWPHIIEMVEAFLSELLIIILKSRQIGASWIVAYYCLWRVRFQVAATIVLQSKGEVEAIELLAKAKRGYGQLPPILRKYKLSPNSDTVIGFPELMGQIRAFPSTTSAGISFTASVVVGDELEEHEYAEQNYNATMPTRDAGGQFIGIFTVNKSKGNTVAKTLFKGAPQNGFHAMFFPYTVRPGRDSEWYERTKRSVPEMELGKLSPEVYMQQNYPASVEEALLDISSISAFDHSVLHEMIKEAKAPITIERELDYNIVNIYVPFHIGDFYVAGSDVSLGVGKDYNVTCILNIRTQAVVADIMNNKLTPEEFALHSIKLLDAYMNPKWWIEYNLYGRRVVATAIQLGYKNLGYRDTKRTNPGWFTNDKTRIDLYGGLVHAINNRQLTIYNPTGIKQFYDIIRNADKNGRIEAMSGRNDDYPIAVGICWAQKDTVKTGIQKSKPIETLTFSKGEAINQDIIDQWTKGE